jgi:hypothetical protein
MMKRSRLAYIAIFLILIAGGVYFKQTVFAVSKKSPENGWYVTRYHDSGNITQITLSIYTEPGLSSAPTGKKIVLKRANGDFGCKPATETYTNSIEIDAKFGGVSGSGKDSSRLPNFPRNLNSGNCKDDDMPRPRGTGETLSSGVFREYSIPNEMWYKRDGTGTLDSTGTRYRADLTFNLIGGSSSGKHTGKKRAWFSFTVVAASGSNDLYITNRANSKNDPNFKTNYGVTQGSETGTIRRDGEDRAITRYEIPFAKPCTDNSNGSQEVGMWDPDEFYNRMKVQESPRTGNSWTDTSISNRGGMTGGANSSGYYTPEKVNNGIASLRFKMDTDKKYRVVLITERANVVSLFWPYDSINSEIRCDYELTPNVTLNGASLSGGGQVLTSDPDMMISGSAPVINGMPSAYPPTERSRRVVTKFVYSSLPNTSAKLLINTDPCASFSGAINCVSILDQTSVRLSASVNPASFSYRTTSSDIGRYICFVNSVSPPRDAYRRPPNWSHSAMQCTFVAKRPKVHITGGDLRVAGTIRASVSSGIGANNRTFGSWIEYGVFSTGSNILAGSGSSFRDGTTSADNSWSQLTFSNNTSTKGNYGAGSLPAATTVSDFDSLQSTSNILSGDVDLSSLGDGVYNVTGNAKISGAVTAKNKSIIIRSSGTVTISGDIIVNNGIYNSPGEISQVIILAKDITVSRDVSRVDAWLLTRSGGSVNTCHEAGSTGSLVVSSCPNQLQVNGAVITDKLYLRRTGGADAETHAVAAEVFNLRASSYMWAYNFANRYDRAQTAYVKELPPRL